MYGVVDRVGGVVGDGVGVFEVVGDVFEVIVVEVRVGRVREVGGEVVGGVEVVGGWGLGG